jgi:ferric-chelate reductase
VCRLRILQGNRKWESHPFTIANAPALDAPDIFNPKGSFSRGLLLYVRAAGDFTRALNTEARLHSGFEANVIVDGPYGGIGAGMIDVADSRNVVLVAGGSGASFAVAVLEDLITRSVRGKACTEMADLIWVVKV